jgi:hypothetical protein
MWHKIPLALLIAIPLANGHNLGSLDKMLRRYHAGQYEILIRRMAHGPHFH